jgi:hypothetical protein
MINYARSLGLAGLLLLSTSGLAARFDLTLTEERKQQLMQIARRARIVSMAAAAGFLSNKYVSHWLPANALGIALTYSAACLTGDTTEQDRHSAVCAYTLGSLVGNQYKHQRTQCPLRNYRFIRWLVRG